MTNLGRCDLPSMLEQVGVAVVIAGRRVCAVVRPRGVDDEFRDVQATVVGKSGVLTVRTDDMKDVAEGASLEVTEGPYKGTYKLQRRMDVGNHLTKLLALKS